MVAAALAASGAVALPSARGRAVSALLALLVTPVLLVGELWSSPQIEHVRHRPGLAAAALAGGILLVAALAVAFTRWPGLLPPPGGIGLLLLKGLVIRRVGIDGKFGAEVLGEGDLLRPWQYDGDAGTLPLTTDWTVLESMRLAVLDEEFVARLSDYPELAPLFVARAMQRARNLAPDVSRRGPRGQRASRAGAQLPRRAQCAFAVRQGRAGAAGEQARCLAETQA